MSSFMQGGAPPLRIPIGGGAGAGGSGASAGGPPLGGPPQQNAASGQPDMAKVKASLSAAIDDLNDAAEAEGDQIDKAQIHQLIAKVHSLLAAGQKTEDTVMGAGPGVRMVRKSSGGGAGVNGTAAY